MNLLKRLHYLIIQICHTVYWRLVVTSFHEIKYGGIHTLVLIKSVMEDSPNVLRGAVALYYTHFLEVKRAV